MLHILNGEHYFLAQDQLDTVGLGGANDRFIIEPVGRNTAGAIALAALTLPQDEIMLVLPSDHIIADEAAYLTALNEAGDLAEQGFLTLFGIKPTYPETGYGYIEASDRVVSRFLEKPDRALAEKLIAQGGVYWNSGMFCFSAGAILQALKTHAPKLLAACEAALAHAKTADRALRITHEAMSAIDSISIDNAVMEKADGVRMVAIDAGWSDMGSFESLYSELPKDANGNTDAEAILVGSTGNLIVGGDRLIAIIDANDLMIVDTADALLVAKRGSGQKVREVVAALKASGNELFRAHRESNRPWGSFEILDTGSRFKIKRLVVKAGKRLSLQKHFHRNEHWIVLSGMAKVTIEDQQFLVCPNESTYIHAGKAHRLENPGKLDLVMIEAQVGDYLGEDDIVRIDDDYAR